MFSREQTIAGFPAKRYYGGCEHSFPREPGGEASAECS
jgi:hypothetical protein